MKTVLCIDQSTQGTKALLLDEEGRVIARAARPHRQIVDGRGYISHDLDEIWQNVLLVARECVGENAASVKAVGISNQRETSCMWNDEGPLADAVVWQCARGKDISDALAPYAELVREKTGLPLSPYFPAAKYAWLLQNTKQEGKVHLGTVDSFLVWKLTGNFYTDDSNASRTQLFNIHSLQWDEELCALFGVPMEALPEVLDSDGVFGYTDLGGILSKKVPVSGVLGDSHAALFAEGCLAAGQGKVTYGTGSSVMMNVGEKPVESSHGLASSIAWKIGGKVNYVLEGNINYSCAVITWLKDDLGLISDAKEVGSLAAEADPSDEAVLIPAFSGLSAPYWKPEARAAILNMSRTTGKKELCRAAEESIAFQIADILDALRADTGLPVREVRADGGAAGDAFLMQLQADASGASVLASDERELSPLGAGWLAGISAGVYGEEVLKGEARRFAPREDARVKAARARWKNHLKKL
ncbi:MAG TPA: glycerol kinase [Candidatus Gallimonas intestinavium]|uniref:ATP:glycerol 3-phosphotransferase n=1 Tax=Candidatus Gallimonas intestinavium TaxID=2838603 RepID=A0A9D2G674_9FIRM|nr:glycerol kinase [Candidatus Gallimonas intestinavium]